MNCTEAVERSALSEYSAELHTADIAVRGLPGMLENPFWQSNWGPVHLAQWRQHRDDEANASTGVIEALCSGSTPTRVFLIEI